jgi:two-component system phosphate regulon sensor histidine kinase PhoR
MLDRLRALIPPGAVATPEAARTIRREGNPTERLSASSFAAALSDPVIFFDKDGLVVDANRAAHDMFGKLDAGLGLLLKFRAPDIRGLVEQLLAGNAAPAIDYIERVPLERMFRVSGSRVGEDGLFVLIFKDQSEVRRIDRMRADFIANASHELRTPLASVAGFIETLRGPAKDDPKARAQFLDIMQNQAGRMARLLDDLLSLSRLEMKPRLDGGARVELKEIIRAVLDTLGPMAAETKVVIDTRLPEGDATVIGDRDELFQVVQNLIENACKYGRSGGRVIVAIEPQADGVDLSVTDFGPGIPAEHIPRITERFYRVEAEGGRVEKGTGLGLAIVKHILARHNARLSITSQPNVETRFTAHFPPME